MERSGTDLFLRKLADEIVEEVPDWIRGCREDINYFLSEVMLDPEGNYWGELRPYQKKWQYEAGGKITDGKVRWRNTRLVILAPPECGKSSQLVVGRLLWLFGRNPNLRFAIVSDTDKQAQKFLSEIRTNVMINEKLKQVFPGLKPEGRKGRTSKWGDDGIVFQRDIVSKDWSIQALGVRGPLLSSRLDGIILDDVLSWENTLTAYQRDKTNAWFISIVPGRIVKRGQILLVGLTWDNDDLLHTLVTKKKYKELRYSLQKDDNCGYVDWEEVWPKWRIEESKRELGIFEFNRQMRNLLPKTKEGRRPFKKEYCEKVASNSRGLWMNSYKGSDIVLTGVDLATRKGKHTAETVFFTISLDQYGFRQVLNILAGQLEGPEIIETVLDLWRRFRPYIFGVENNAAQIYIEQFLKDGRVLAAFGANPQEAAGIRVQGLYTGTKSLDPLYGIPGLSIDFQAGKWGAPEHEETQNWLRECYEWFPGRHPGDRLAASFFANELARGNEGQQVGDVVTYSKEKPTQYLKQEF